MLCRNNGVSGRLVDGASDPQHDGQAQRPTDDQQQRKYQGAELSEPTIYISKKSCLGREKARNKENNLEEDGKAS